MTENSEDEREVGVQKLDEIRTMIETLQEELEIYLGLLQEYEHGLTDLDHILDWIDNTEQLRKF